VYPRPVATVPVVEVVDAVGVGENETVVVVRKLAPDGPAGPVGPAGPNG